jgi:hypothetical protein
MKRRCLNKKDKSYDYYGGRGIVFCKEWIEFENFLKDMGEAPIGHTLDRIDVSGNYCKSNCKWSTHKTQMNNTRRNTFLTFIGKTQTISQWSDETGISQRTISARCKMNWPIYKILTIPTRSHK